MTYNVSSGTLNLTQLNSNSIGGRICCYTASCMTNPQQIGAVEFELKT